MSPEQNCSNPLDTYPQFSPSLQGLTPGEPLYDFFLPMIQAKETQIPGILAAYEFGMSCLSFARLTAELFGGPECAKIYWIEKYAEPDAKVFSEELLAHAYVIPNSASLKSLAYNNMGLDVYTVEQVLAEGEDITEETFALPWGAL